MHSQRFYTLSASCPDSVGIIARVAGFIADPAAAAAVDQVKADQKAKEQEKEKAASPESLFVEKVTPELVADEA